MDTESITAEHRRKRSLGRYYIYYTVGFVILSALVFSPYIATGRTFIWTDDAWSQHYKALVYYSRYLREALRCLFSGAALPRWDFAIGEGADILTTLHYYVIGDPLSLFSVFVPERYIHILYDALIILRLYLAGVLFSAFAFLCGYKNRRAVLTGSFTYCFCFWAIVNAGRHPYFLNPMLYFPLLLIGFELVFRRRRPYVLILAVAISAASNFYFFYMLVAASVLYVVCRLFVKVRRGEESAGRALRLFLRIAMASVLGVMIAAVIMLPVGMTFLRESRASVDYKVGIFYPLQYYIGLPGMLAGDTGGEYWLCAGFSVVWFPCVILLFRKKRHPLLKLFYVAAALIVTFPVLGHALNGFTYVTNRWTWALAFLAAFTVTAMWRTFAEMDAADFLHVAAAEFLLFILCLIFGDSRTLGSMAALAVTFLLLILTAPRTDVFGKRLMKRIRCERIMAAVSCAGIVVSALCYSSPIGENNVAEHVPSAGIAEALMNNEAETVKGLAEKEGVTDFYRYSGPHLTENAGLLSGVSSTQYYWSLSNPNVIERNNALAIRDYWLSEYGGCDGRTVMNMLASVRYYVTAGYERSPVPDGFSAVMQYSDPDGEPGEGYRVYENENALPFGYTYSHVLDACEWEALDPAAREEAMMYGALVDGNDDNDGGEPTGLPTLGVGERIMGTEVPYGVTCYGDGVTYEDGRFIVTNPYSSAALRFDSVMASEMFLYFSDFEFVGTSDFDLYLGGDDVDPNDKFTREAWDALPAWDKWQTWQDEIFWTNPTGVMLSMRSGTVSNSMLWYTSGYQFYNGRDDFLINLGSHFGGDSSITITFPKAGVYSFGGLLVITRPFSAYDGVFEALAEDTLTDVVFGTDSVMGKISLEVPKLLCLSIPYSDGWEAYVDGEPVKTLRVNKAYTGIMLGSGAHTVEMRYRTPFLSAGAAVSAVGGAIFAAVAVVTETGIRRRRRAEKEAD